MREHKQRHGKTLMIYIYKYIYTYQNLYQKASWDNHMTSPLDRVNHFNWKQELDRNLSAI